MTRNAQQPVSLSSQKTMALQKLQLSLQFGDVPYAAKHRTALPRHFVARCIRHALSDDAEITVRVVSEAEGRALNHSYRRKDYATNALTFDYAQAPVVIADIVLCAPVVATEAKAQGKTLQAHYAHLLVHGTLHAQGWDHESSAKDAREMEGYEVDLLAELGFKNPYI